MSLPKAMVGAENGYMHICVDCLDRLCMFPTPLAILADIFAQRVLKMKENKLFKDVAWSKFRNSIPRWDL